MGEFLSSRRNERQLEREALRQRLDHSSPTAPRPHLFETSVSEAALALAETPREMAKMASGADHLLNAALRLVTPRGADTDPGLSARADLDLQSRGGTACASHDVSTDVEGQTGTGEAGEQDMSTLASVSPSIRKLSAQPSTTPSGSLLAERAESVGQLINAALLLPEGTTIHPLITPRSPATPQSRGDGRKRDGDGTLQDYARDKMGALSADVRAAQTKDEQPDCGLGDVRGALEARASASSPPIARQAFDEVRSQDEASLEKKAQKEITSSKMPPGVQLKKAFASGAQYCIFWKQDGAELYPSSAYVTPNKRAALQKARGDNKTFASESSACTFSLSDAWPVSTCAREQRPVEAVDLSRKHLAQEFKSESGQSDLREP